MTGIPHSTDGLAAWSGADEWAEWDAREHDAVRAETESEYAGEVDDQADDDGPPPAKGWADDLDPAAWPMWQDTARRLARTRAHADRRAAELAGTATRPEDHEGGPVAWDATESGHATP